MSVIEASFNGTLRTIGLLVIAWWVLRWFLRMQRTQAARGSFGKPPQQTPNDLQRPKGEVRVERPSDCTRTDGRSCFASFTGAGLEETPRVLNAHHRALR